MTLTCKCGNKFKSIDPNVDSGIRNLGHIVWETIRIKPGVATWKCEGCGAVREQRLRQKLAK